MENGTMRKAIDLYLISGFLGSGKTTFLQRLLNNLEGKRIGVLVNEFGSVGIDGRIIEKDGIQLVEINNGSIFCSCIKGDFIKALIEFTTKDIDALFVENSGMADPSNVHQIMEEVGLKVTRPYHYQGAVCIVDSVSFLKYVKVLAPVQNQIAASNFIVVNKIDQVNESVIDDIVQTIHGLNPSAYLYKTMYSDVPISVLEEYLCDNGFIGETSNQCYNRPSSYSIEGEGSYEEQSLIELIHRINPYVLRMKGFLKGEQGWSKVDVVNGQIEMTKVQLGKRDIIQKTKLVIIGHDTGEFKKELKTTWVDVFGEIPEIYE
jgi:G3E family GTPase